MERKSALTIQLLRELIRQLQECTWEDPPLGLETEIDPEIEIAEGAPVHTPGTVVAGAAIDQDQDRTPVDAVIPHPVGVTDLTPHADIK